MFVKGKAMIYKKILISLVILSLFNGCGQSSNTSSTPPTASTPPQNEPYFKYLWHLDSSNSQLNSMGYTINEDADINVLDAWNITKGSGVKVAIIDCELDINHEDITSNVVKSYNADTDTNDISNEVNIGTHGTICMGFISSPANSKGIVGVAPEASLIAVKQCDFSDSKTIKAFEYAKEQGAKVVSCSWGTGDVSQAVAYEIKSLYNAGITVVFASGNEGTDFDKRFTYDESELDWVIGVGGTSEENEVTYYSNYGSNIDIVAPSGDMDESVGLLGLDSFGNGNHQNGIVDSKYSFVEGTSFSAPIVAGVVALMYSVNPNITPYKIRDILIKSADKIGDTTYDTNGFDINKKRAYGKVNASKALFEAMK
jgi:subtilisin family serine protease